MERGNSQLDFLLDQDVSAAVARMLRARGFRVESAYSVGLSDADDDDLSVWADDRGAILISHDREFSRRRRAMPVGRHLELRCKERAAAELLAGRLAEVLEILRNAEDVTVVVSATGVAVHHGRP